MTEHEAAAAWRRRRGLTPAQLAELTGYSKEAIYWAERGETPPNRNHKSGNTKDRVIKSYVWQRYKNACAGVDRFLKSGKSFDWK